MHGPSMLRPCACIGLRAAAGLTAWQGQDLGPAVSNAAGLQRERCCGTDACCTALHLKQARAAQEATQRMQAALQEDKLQQYAVVGDLDKAAGGKVPASGLLSVPSAAGEQGGGKRAQDKGAQLYKKTKRKGQGRPGSAKKRRGSA